jgi:TRAP-type mannitol/chloroaromatic compound transport system permease large subunit
MSLKTLEGEPQRSQSFFRVTAGSSRNPFEASSVGSLGALPFAIGDLTFNWQLTREAANNLLVNDSLL